MRVPIHSHKNTPCICPQGYDCCDCGYCRPRRICNRNREIYRRQEIGLVNNPFKKVRS